MRSRAHLSSHPMHPMLIPFPFAFLAGAVIFDVAGRVTGNSSLWTTGSHLSIAGVIAALVAAVPGIIDYLTVIPPNSSGKKRATWHMVVNLAVVALFLAAWLLRGEATTPPSNAILALELVAAALLMVGGWMGGTLVHRNQIGVDHRYAHAGKWREATVDLSAGGTAAVPKGEGLKVDQMMLVHVRGTGDGQRRVVIGRTEEGYVAFDDHCTHRGASLADGALICGTVQCPWHGSQFDVRTGAVGAGPAKEPIATYSVEESDKELRLTLSPQGAARR